MESKTPRKRTDDDLSVIHLPDNAKKGTFQIQVEQGQREVFLKITYESASKKKAIAQIPVDNLIYFVHGEYAQDVSES